MKRFSQSQRVELPDASPATDAALAIIREQFLRLDPDEQRILRRILRQAERLDIALADLHLVLPAVEICFYGIEPKGDTGHRLTPKHLRKLIQRRQVAKPSKTGPDKLPNLCIWATEHPIPAVVL